MIIGNFTKTDENGFRGTLRTATLNLDIAFEPVADKKGEKMPDYRVSTGDTELGAAWKQTSENTGKPYLSVQLDDPALPAPLRCALVKTGSEHGYTLVWERSRKRKTDTTAKEF